MQGDSGNSHNEYGMCRFKLASQKCSEAKATIESETQTVEKLQQTVAEKMDQVRLTSFDLLCKLQVTAYTHAFAGVFSSLIFHEGSVVSE